MITDTGLAHVAALQQLTSPNPTFCGKITDTGLAHVATLQRLTSLNLNPITKPPSQKKKRVLNFAIVLDCVCCFVCIGLNWRWFKIGDVELGIRI